MKHSVHSMDNPLEASKAVAKFLSILAVIGTGARKTLAHVWFAAAASLNRTPSVSGSTGINA